MKELVDYIARELVENPDDVVTTEEWDGSRYVVHLDVAEGDMGKVIGRGGRVAEAMRALLKVSAARQDTRAVLDIEIAPPRKSSASRSSVCMVCGSPHCADAPAARTRARTGVRRVMADAPVKEEGGATPPGPP